jgi:pilus assembly protein Flp/PilA
MKNLFARFVKDESGATAIEYGLIAALIGVAIIVAATALGSQLSGTFSTISVKLASATSKA